MIQIDLQNKINNNAPASELNQQTSETYSYSKTINAVLRKIM